MRVLVSLRVLSLIMNIFLMLYRRCKDTHYFTSVVIFLYPFIFCDNPVIILASPSQAPPRCSAPRRSLCLVSGSATAATVPRRTRLVPHCVHRSTNAARAAYPNPAGLVEVLHIVFIPSAAQGLLLPFAASVAPWAFSSPQTRLPQLHRECPTLRGLTTPFRSDGQTTAP